MEEEVSLMPLKCTTVKGTGTVSCHVLGMRCRAFIKQKKANRGIQNVVLQKDIESYMGRSPNKWMDSNQTLLAYIRELKLSYYRYIMRITHCLEKDIRQSCVLGSRSQGWPRRWTGDISELMGWGQQCSKVCRGQIWWRGITQAASPSAGGRH